MRRIPWAADYLEQAACRKKNPAQYKGRWKSVLGKGPLHLEIGCGKGGYSLEMARRYGKESFIAVEKNESAAGLAAKKFDENGLPNLALVYGDAAALDEWFEPGELDVIHLNFSDPWPKKRNAKRRLSAPSFAESYLRLLSDQGELQMKTDNAALFEYSLVQLDAAGFALKDVSVDFRREPHAEDAFTEYEQKFTQAGQPVYRAVWQKRKA